MLVAIRSSICVHEFKDFLSLYIFMNNIGDICTKITAFKLRCALKSIMEGYHWLCKVEIVEHRMFRTMEFRPKNVELLILMYVCKL